MTDDEKEAAANRFGEMFHDFEENLLPSGPLDMLESCVVAIHIRAIIQHPDGTQSFTAMNGAKSRPLLEAILGDVAQDALDNPDHSSEWTEDPRDRNSGRFDIN